MYTNLAAFTPAEGHPPAFISINKVNGEDRVDISVRSAAPENVTSTISITGAQWETLKAQIAAS